MDKALQTMIDNMPAKTGKSLNEWFTVLAKENFAKHGEAVKFLKTEHSVTHGFANTIVTLFRQQETQQPQEEDLVANQYQGKESLKPMYDQLLSIVQAFGEDVQVTPKKTSVSIIRKKQFALIKPATKTRIDLGLKLKDTEVQGILENSGPFGTMCTHRIQLKTVDDINEEVTQWLQLAYDKSV